MAGQTEKINLQTKTDGKQTEVIREEGDDYDPHLFREVPKATNNFETLVHLLKSSLGTGILAMPQAFAKAGLVTAIVSTILIGILCTYCLQLLVKVQYGFCKRRRVPLLTYPKSMEVALEEGPECMHSCAKFSPILVDIFIIVYQLGIGCVYIVFIGTNIKAIVDPFYLLPLYIHMFIILLPLIGLNCIRNLKLLAPFSTVANVITFVGLGIIVYYLLTKPAVKEEYDLWGTVTAFPLFFGTTLFALTAVGVVIALENNMKTPKSFGSPCGVLNIGMSFIVILYISIGVLGYVFCKSKCEDSITMNLPKNDMLAMSVQILLTIAIFLSYALQCYVPVDIVWRTYILPKVADKPGLMIYEYSVRIGLCILTFVLAVLIPKLGLFISLFGALCLSALGLMFPALMDICLRFSSKMYGPFQIIFAKNVLIIIIGLIGLTAGTYSALYAIVLSFTEEFSRNGLDSLTGHNTREVNTLRATSSSNNYTKM